MRKKWLILIASILILCTAGCKSGELKEITAKDIFSENLFSPFLRSSKEYSAETLSKTKASWKAVFKENTSTEEAIEESEGFSLSYDGKKTDIIISPDDCDCEYDQDGIRIYSKYMSNSPWVALDFPHFQYVLYLQTPAETIQLFPVRDFIISQDEKILYAVREREGFEVLQKMNLSIIDVEDDFLAYDMINSISLEGMIEKAHQLAQTEDVFSDLHFEIAGIEESGGSTILKGEASGIYKATGKKFYIDYEWQEALGKESAIPCILPTYDTDRDAEDFKRCQEAYDRIEKGDWSMLIPSRSVEYEWEAYQFQYAVTNYSQNAEEEKDRREWRQADLNGDGMPELISQNGNGDRTEHKKPIDLIFSWHEDKVELVYVDYVDAMEFLFLSDNGQLLYEESVLGGPQTSVFVQYYFDEKWNLTFEKSLKLFYFYDESEYQEKYLESDKEYYSDTFGTYGGGLYYVKYRLKTKEELEEDSSSYTVKELLTQEEFLKEYQNMTGQNFLEDNASYWKEWFFSCFTADTQTE